MPESNILKEIIEGYRHLLHQRYQYQNIVNKFDIPDFITADKVDEIREYFLNYIYPEYSKRVELNEAFESLDSYVKRPEKLLRMLMDSISLIFSHGRHLPKILNTGLKAIRSFRAANQLESWLAEEATKNEMDPPFDEEKINTLLKSLPNDAIEQFIENSESLIFVFRDQKLIKEVEEILVYLISRMKEKPNLYSRTEISGIELALGMLTQGNALFHSFSAEDQETLIHLIVEIERSILDSLKQE